MDENQLSGKVRWPHAPPHFLVGNGTFMVTASTYGKSRHFNSKKRLRFLHDLIHTTAETYGWQLEAWAIMENHYHWIGKSPQAGAEYLGEWIGKVHRESAMFLNELDKTRGRKVWHNYRETRLTFEKSYLARLRYVIENPVKHGIVAVAADYPWCSAAWFSKHSSIAFQKTVASFKINQLKIEDDF